MTHRFSLCELVHLCIEKNPSDPQVHFLWACLPVHWEKQPTSLVSVSSFTCAQKTTTHRFSFCELILPVHRGEKTPHKFAYLWACLLCFKKERKKACLPAHWEKQSTSSFSVSSFYLHTKKKKKKSAHKFDFCELVYVHIGKKMTHKFVFLWACLPAHWKNTKNKHDDPQVCVAKKTAHKLVTLSWFHLCSEGNDSIVWGFVFYLCIEGKVWKLGFCVWLWAWLSVWGRSKQKLQTLFVTGNSGNIRLSCVTTNCPRSVRHHK